MIKYWGISRSSQITANLITKRKKDRVMLIDKKLMDELSSKARKSPRLRTNFDLRNSENDQSQRMLNVLEPGTIMAIHRHLDTNETICMIRGSVKESIYDEYGNVLESYILKVGSDSPAMVIPAGVWHKLECLESGSILLTVKDGKYSPLKKEDILTK